MPLTGTVSRTQASLDAPSAFALEYAQAFLLASGRQSVPSSAVIRRALALYVVHLAGHKDHPQELREVLRASSAPPMEQDSRKEATVRFQEATAAATQGTLPGSFKDLLWGPNHLDVAALNQRAEDLAATVMREQRGRLSIRCAKQQTSQ